MPSNSTALRSSHQQGSGWIRDCKSLSSLTMACYILDFRFNLMLVVLFVPRGSVPPRSARSSPFALRYTLPIYQRLQHIQHGSNVPRASQPILPSEYGHVRNTQLICDSGHRPAPLLQFHQLGLHFIHCVETYAPLRQLPQLRSELYSPPIKLT